MISLMLLVLAGAPNREVGSGGVIQTSYASIRAQVRPGDVIAFSGKARISRIIRWVTRSNVSHVGVVLDASEESGGTMVESSADTLLPESWHRKGARTEGVRISRIDDHLAHYKGTAWLLPLAEEVRARGDWIRFGQFLNQQRTKGYDRVQMVKMAMSPLFRVPLLGRLLRNQENLDKYFCSELVAAALRSSGVITGLNASQVTPKRLCRLPIYGGSLYQLTGGTASRPGFVRTTSGAMPARTVDTAPRPAAPNYPDPRPVAP